MFQFTSMLARFFYVAIANCIYVHILLDRTSGKLSQNCSRRCQLKWLPLQKVLNQCILRIQEVPMNFEAFDMSVYSVGQCKKLSMQVC